MEQAEMKLGINNFFQSKSKVMTLLVAVFCLGIAYWAFSRETDRDRAADSLQSAEHMTGAEHSPGAAPQTDATIYVCPMMCVPPMAKFGSCPVCGMDLTPASEGQKHDHDGPPQIILSQSEIKLAEIQVAPVERKFVSAAVRLFGRIDYDPAHMTKITAFMPGVIDRVHVKRAGQFVRWGDALFDVYSSDLLETQRELLEIMEIIPAFFAFQRGAPYIVRDAPIQLRRGPQTGGRQSPEVEAAYQKLSAIRYKLSILGLPKRDIDELMQLGEATGIATVYAPMYGQVIEHNAYEGTYVNTGSLILSIADPQFVWARLDAYETDFPWMRIGQKVTFETVAYPGEIFAGKVVYIDPVFNRKTRTFSIGAISPDQGGRLKAGMLVRATVEAQMSADGKVVTGRSATDRAPLIIPASAPLITGKRSVVYVAVSGNEGVFEGREVVLGPKTKNHYLVVSGLEEGELVVVNGSFKIDSAVQILARSSMMDKEGGHSATAHQLHGGSHAMHENYRTERMRSRMLNRPESDEAHSDMHSQIKPNGNSGSGRRRHERTAIQRRKPGQYGDTTRIHRPLTGQRLKHRSPPAVYKVGSQ